MALVTPEYLQIKKYRALRDRLVLQHGGQIQAGVWDANDFKIVQRALGANMSVDVGSGFALVPATDPGNRGLYHIENDATLLNVVVGASHATLPRIDQVIVSVNDTTDGGDGTDVPAVSVLAGTATSGATLDNRTGAAAMPTSSLRLADILVPAASSTVVTANIRDRRPWARGFNYVVFRTAGDIAFPTGGSGFVAIDANAFQRRFELGAGSSVEVELTGTLLNSATGALAQLRLMLNGAAAQETRVTMPGTSTQYSPTLLKYRGVPGAGSYLAAVQAAQAASGGVSLLSTATLASAYTIREVLAPNVDNGVA